MASDNMALLIDPETRDILFDDEGIMRTIYDDETTAQCIRLTLQTWLRECFLDTTHGTDYERILGKKPYELPADEIGEVLRAAIYQEKDVSYIEKANADIEGKTINATFAATLYSGKVISMEVVS